MASLFDTLPGTSHAALEWEISPNVTVLAADDGVLFVTDGLSHVLKCDGDFKIALSSLSSGDTVERLEPILGPGGLNVLIDSMRSARLLVKRVLPKPSAEDELSRNVGWLALHHEDPYLAQCLLTQKTVAIIGVGGLGTHILEHLRAVGVRNFVLVDHDLVEISNLNRQYLFAMADIGRAKVTAATQRVRERNPAVNIFPVITMIQSEEDLNFLSSLSLDFLVLAADTPTLTIDQLVDNHCWNNSIPWIRGGVGLSRGYWGPIFVAGKTACHTCFGQALQNTWTADERRIVRSVPAQSPYSNGATNALIAAAIARDVILHLIGAEHVPSVGRRIIIDLLSMETTKFQIQPCGCYRK